MFRKITKKQFSIFLLLAAFLLICKMDISAACVIGNNLIVNGDAEADANSYASGNDIDVTGWEPETGEFTIGKYGVDSFPNATDPGPTDRGSFLFTGGNVASSSGTQRIDVSDCATQIDAGTQSYNLSGYFGGYTLQDDNAQLKITFRSAADNVTGTTTIGPVFAADRGNVSGLLARSATGTVPIGTRTVEVVLLLTRTSGTYNDGYADNLSFMLTAPTAATVSVSGRVVTAEGFGISNARVVVTNAAGETQRAITNKQGFYHIAEISAGETCIFSISHKYYEFAEPTQVHFVTEENEDINFTALPGFLKKERLK